MDDGESLAVFCTDDFTEFLFPALEKYPLESTAETDNEEDISLGESISES